MKLVSRKNPIGNKIVLLKFKKKNMKEKDISLSEKGHRCWHSANSENTVPVTRELNLIKEGSIILCNIKCSVVTS